MKEYIKNLPDPIGKCPICTINLYPLEGKMKPAVLPCGVEDCPYESKSAQALIDYRKGKLNR